MKEIKKILENHENRIKKIEGVLSESLKHEGKKIKCSHCNYFWETRSKSILISCPNCGQKTRNETKEEEKKRKEKRAKENPDYAPGHDIETIGEEVGLFE